MKAGTRIIFTLLSVVASYFFIFWVPFSFIPEARNTPIILIVVSLLIAVIIGGFVWKKNRNNFKQPDEI